MIVGERRHSDIEAGKRGQAEHAAIEDRFFRRSRRPVERAGLAALEGQGNVLDAVGDEVQPKKLHRRQRRRQARQDRQREQHDLGSARRHHQSDDFADIGVGEAPFLDAADDRAEIVVDQQDVGGIARHVGAVAGHRHADIGRAQRWRIVHAIAGDGDDLALGLQGAHDGELLHRLHPGEDARARHCRNEGVALQRGKIAAGHDFGLVFGQTQLTGDRQGRAGMIAGDHADPDAGTTGGGDCCGRIRAQRIENAGQTEQAQPAERPRRWRWYLAARHRNDAKAPLGQRVGRRQCRRIDVDAHRQHGLGSAFDMRPHRLAASLERGAVFQLRLVGHRAALRAGAGIGQHAAIARQDEERPVDRVATAALMRIVRTEPCFVADRGTERECRCARIVGRAETGLRQPQLDDGQPVESEGARLVAGDGRASAQALDSRQPPHDDPPCRHAANGYGQGDGHRHRQALGYGGYRQRHPQHQNFRDRRAAHDLDRRQRGDNHRHAEGKSAGEAGHAPHERRRRRRIITQRTCNAPDLGVLTGGDDDGGGAAVQHCRPGMQHRRAIARHGFRRDRRRCALRRRHRFAGQEALVDGKLIAVEQPHVGRHFQPGRQRDDIARHEIASVEFDLPPVATHGHDAAHKRLQATDAPFRTPFLPGADGGVHRQHDSDETRIGKIAQNQRQHGGRQQQVDERAAELAQQDGRQIASARFGQDVGPDGLTALLDLDRCQPLRTRSQRCHDVRRRQGVPRGTGIEGIGHNRPQNAPSRPPAGNDRAQRHAGLELAATVAILGRTILGGARCGAFSAGPRRRCPAPTKR